MTGQDGRTDAPRWLAGAVRAVTLTGDSDPRVPQLVLTAFVVVDCLIRGLGGLSLELGSLPGAGLALLVAMCVITYVVPWHRLPAWSVAIIPMTDFAAIGLVRTVPGGSAAGLLVVAVAIWMGHRLGRVAAPLSVLGVLFLTYLPSLLREGPDPVEVSRGLLVAVVSGWCALAIALAIERVEAQRDEAERRGAELSDAMETIEHQRRISDAILDTADVGLVLLDRDGRYSAINRRHADFLRLAYPEGHGGLAGQVGVVHAADGVTVMRREELPTYRASRGEELDDCRIWVGDDPRTRRALSVSARTVRDSHGEFAGAALAYTDITELMRALQVKDEFVAAVSHELRTPLTPLLGYLQLVRESDGLPQDLASHLEVVQRNAERLLRLVGDLLHTAQADGRAVAIRRAPAELCGVVRDALDAVGPKAAGAGLTLTSDLPDELVAHVDEQRIAQVVDNLLSNAVKYTPAGGEVHVCLAIDGDRVELLVADTGIGIAPADRDRLFQRFYRARDAEDRLIPGLGLGLSITRSIVESHGGRIEVDSEPGTGTRVRVRLPRD